MFATKLALSVALVSVFLTASIGAQISSTYLPQETDFDYADYDSDYKSTYGSDQDVDDDQDVEGPLVKGVVTNGEPAEASFAYTVAVGKWGRSFCGGWLYDADTVVTAASCVNNSRTAFEIQVTVNRYDLNDRTKGQVIQVDNFKSHELYNPKTHNFDIAVLKLKDPAQIEVPFAKPAGDVTRDTLQPGFKLIVLGWGSVSKEVLAIPPDLRQGTVTYVGSRQCDEEFYGGEKRVTDQMVCGRSTNGQDQCSGDGGGPLVLQNLRGGQDEVVGVVSWGEGCDNPQKPGVYTAMTRQIVDWIEKTAGSL